MPPRKKRKRSPATKAAKSNLPNPISDVPPNRVGAVVQSFITNDGVKQMVVNEQPDRNFTVTPTR